MMNTYRSQGVPEKNGINPIIHMLFSCKSDPQYKGKDIDKMIRFFTMVSFF